MTTPKREGSPIAKPPVPDGRGDDSDELVDTISATNSPSTSVDGPRAQRVSAGERTLAKGALLGRYVVLDRIGAGGMGVVYAGHDPELNRKVALKLVGPRPRHDDQARILREAQALARLQHPNVVTVYDVGSYEKGVFLAMELVEGRTLTAWWEERERSWSEIVAIFLAAAEGLAAAHEKHLIHRDFKPGNVLVGTDGRVRVTDFGLARGEGLTAGGAWDAELTEADLVGDADDSSPPRTPSIPQGSPSARDLLGEDLTREGLVTGTPAYMAPEIYRGHGGEAADQFAFAVSLYEALYQQMPFDRKSKDEAARWTVRNPPAKADVPTWLEKVVMRGLALDPSERFPSMSELANALRKDRALRRRIALPNTAARGRRMSTASSPKQVFLMDDSAFALDLLRTALVEQGVEVTCGREIGELALMGEHLDLVLIDVEMPEAFGDDIASWLLTEGLKAPVYLLSGLPDEQLARRAEECGANGFIPKRIGLDDVLANIYAILEIPQSGPAPAFPIADFLSMAHARVRRARMAVENCDPSPVESELHTLAGEAALIGLGELARTAEACRAAAIDVADAAAFVVEPTLGPLLAAVLEELSKAGDQAKLPSAGTPIELERPARILLLDDSDFYRSTLMALLEDTGYEVIEARRLAEARHRVREVHFDLAIIDVNLEDGRGTDLIPELRQHAPRTRLLLLSGQAMSVADADLVLLKSIDPTELLRHIEKLVRTPRASSAPQR